MATFDPLERLQRNRRLATGLLLLMAAVFVAARLGQGRHAWLAFVAAFAEAAMVGALADWFAVTALFRHPFGLPIPHTAIIPRNKDRIGANIALFLEHNFITHDVLREELAQVDFAGAAAHWLAQSHNSRDVAQRMVSAIPALLHVVEDKDAGEFVRGALTSSLKGVRLAPLLAQLLSVLVAGRQHILLLHKVLGIASHALEQNRPYIRQKVHEHSPKWLPKSVDEKLFERLIDGVQSILDDIGKEDSTWRERFQQAVEDLIDQLSHSPEYEARLRELLASGLSHPLFREYVSRVWTDLRQRLIDSTERPESRLIDGLQNALQGFARALKSNDTIRGKLNTWLRSFAADAIVERRGLIVAVVQRVIDKWDAKTISDKLEIQIGSDLQFIRISGTLVGGVVGLLLYSGSLLLAR